MITALLPAPGPRPETRPPRPLRPAPASRGNRSHRAEVVEWGWTVRLGWPDGTHTLTGFTRDRGRADRKARRVARFWARGPYRPRDCRVVAVSHDRWRAHAALRACAVAGCP